VITVSRSFDPNEVLDAIGRLDVTDIAFLAPTMVKRLVDARAGGHSEISSLKNVVYGGAPMYVDDLKSALDALGPVFTQIYGQAEAPVTIARLTRDDHIRAREEQPERLMSAGQAYTTVQAAVRDAQGRIQREGEGEIVVRGDVVMVGYWRNQAATAEAIRDGWLHTGDLGRIDNSGFIYLLDRSKDVIISGGANIYPREVEELILEHPGVRQVAVVGAPDDEWGERVVAVLVAADGSDTRRVQAEVELLCKEKLAGYKKPREFQWRDQLPTSAYGKILKRELRDSFWVGRARKV
jgi:acyl-CoA synthetase (AMP-forming)/AMP-acid ligase II